MVDALTTELRALIPNPCPLRPFVCNGLPQSCNVLVIGDNPATQMGTDWWRWWNDETGFDLTAFECDYKARRRAIGKREQSPTRRRLGILRDCGLACLETNAHANERPDGHGVGLSNLALVRLFITRLPGLRAIIAHGNEAHRLLAYIDAPASIRRWTPPHFSSRGSQMTNAAVETLGHEIREWISATGPPRAGIPVVAR